MSFWLKSEKKTINSAEFELLFKKITEISSNLEVFSAKIATFSTSLEDLRSRFNRKLSGFKEAPPEPPEEKSENDIKPNVLLTPDGKNF